MAKILFIQKKQLMQKENIAIMQIFALLRQEGHQTDLVLMVMTNSIMPLILLQSSAHAASCVKII